MIQTTTMLILNRDRVTTIIIMITMAVIMDIKISNSNSNSSSSSSKVMEERSAQRTIWVKSKVILLSSFIILLVVAAILISSVVMIIIMFNQLITKYLPNSVDRTLTMVSTRAAHTKLIIITSKDMPDSNSNSREINNKITMEEKLTTTAISMIITRVITRTLLNRIKHSPIITTVAAIMLLVGQVKTATITISLLNSSKDNNNNQLIW